MVSMEPLCASSRPRPASRRAWCAIILPACADLIAETYRWTGKEVEKALRAALSAAPETPEAQLRAFVDASFPAPMLDPDLLGVWLTFWSLTRTDPEIHAIHGKVYADYRKRLQRYIGGIAEEWKIEIDIRLATLAFTAMLDGLLAGTLPRPAPSPPSKPARSPMTGSTI